MKIIKQGKILNENNYTFEDKIIQNRKSHIQVKLVLLIMIILQLIIKMMIRYKINVSGKRIKRGLYQTKKSHYINADINGSFNIMRKYLNVASDHIINGRCRGLVVNPYLVTFK